ncbi:MAG: LPP20 family lipoprotein [Colwellia sp.]|nr:LPP20 family lipoprotein [Colwellia sp.]
MRYTQLVFFLATLLLVLGGCSSTKQAQVNWIEHPSSVYSANIYLSAIGEGNSTEQASQRALANLAKIFSVSISEKHLDESHFSSKKATTDVEVTRYISTTAKNQLNGAYIAEYHQDKQGRFFAIALLKKATAAKQFVDNIRELDNKIVNKIDYAKHEAPNLFSAMSALQQAYTHQQQRNNDNRNLQVVANKGIISPTSSASIEKFFKSELAKLKFVTNSDDDFLVKQLNASAANLGVQVVEHSPLVLSASFILQPILQQENWYWQRGSLALAITEHGKTTRQLRFPLKVSAQQESMLSIRLDDLIVKNMDGYLMELLLSKSQ